MSDAPGEQAASCAGAPDAIAIVLIEHGRMLLARRADTVPRPGVWSPPTGWIERGESAAQAVERETREELGIEARALRELWRCRSDDGRILIAWWLIERGAGALRPTPREIAELRFVDADEYFRLTPTFLQHHGFFASVLPRLIATQVGSRLG